MKRQIDVANYANVKFLCACIVRCARWYSPSVVQVANRQSDGSSGTVRSSAIELKDRSKLLAYSSYGIMHSKTAAIRPIRDIKGKNVEAVCEMRILLK